MSDSRDFIKIADDAIDFLLRCSPVRATQAGLHTYDGELDRADRSARAEKSQRIGKLIEELGGVRTDQLTQDDRFDHQILTGNLHAEVITDTVYRRWDRDPTVPLETALYGCLALIMREFAPFEERVTSLVGRLQAIPRLLGEARTNLGLQDDVPALWTTMAQDLCTSADGFWQSLADDIAPISRQAGELTAAVACARSAVSDYESFLKSHVARRSRGSYAAGWPVFAALLKNLHGIEATAEELIAFGESEMERIKDEVEKTARTIDQSRSASEILEEVKSTPPPAQNLLEVYRDYVAASEQFIRQKNLMSLPGDIALEVVATPEFVRHTYPFAAYASPAPFDSSQKGQYWVTPLPAGLTPEDTMMSLRRHNPFQAQLISLHEGFPGHHVQLTIAAGLASKVRKLFDSNVFVEGWALYCEEMMWEQGFFRDLRYRLMQLYLELWRACRVVIDVKLHTGMMTFAEAVNLLVEVAQLDKLSALAEVKRYTQSPTQPLSYLVGKKQILSLRSDCEKQWEGRFSLKVFHDRLLSLGSVPMNLARTALLEQL